MPRHNRRDEPTEQIAAGSRSFGERVEGWRGEDYLVRTVIGSDKMYRCPGCDQEIRAGQSHVVVWPALDVDATDRRHWHQPCWTARDRRAPAVQRGRSAPRY